MNDEPIFDYATFIHVGIGAAMGYFGLRLEAAGGAIVFLNLITRDLGREAPGLFGDLEPDTWQNSLGDAMAAFVGYYIGRTQMERRATLADL